MKLYDTKSRQLKEVTATDGLLTMYCCGPTVYRDAHVGNLRTFMLADLILRVAALDGVKTKLVQNITDVGHMSEDFTGDDKILAQATIERKSPLEVARKYEEKFHKDLSLLNIATAAAYPRASESIELMQSMIAELVDKGFAYIGGDKTVYFDAEKIQAVDKSYSKGADFFKRTISSSTVLPSDSSLNKFGIDGWEIATSYLEMETVFPNLLASGDGVNGLQPNIRPQRLVVIFKRPSQSK